MRNLSEEIIEFFKENEYIQRVEEMKEKSPDDWMEHLSDEFREFFHKIFDFKNRTKE